MWANQQFATDWALNPSAYKNVSHEDVDWASLAQEWIKMKEVSSVVVTAPPPPPSISAPTKSEKVEEKGEAPMDMDTDERGPDTPTDNPIEVAAPWETWPNWQPQWGWNWPAGTASPAAKIPQPFGQSFAPAEAPTSIDYNHGEPTTHQPVFWTGQSEGPEGSEKDAELPKTFLRNKYAWKRDRERDRKDSVRDSSERQDEDSMEMLDAAKRKQLPAWIREGLEKMEREKQRKLDKERMDKEREEQLRVRKEAEEEALSAMNSVEAAKLLAKSKFDSDGSDVETAPDEHILKTRKSRFQQSPNVEPVPSPKNSTQLVRRERRSTSPFAGPPKTREELLEEVMIKVRRTLTEILLDVTTSEIGAIAREVYQKARNQAPAKRLGKSQAFASIVAKSGLGLGIYGSDGESDTDDSQPGDKDQGYNSEQELEQEIERKKELFAKTEKEIEAQLEAEEEREQERETEKRVASDSSDGESNDAVGQVDRKSEKSKPSPHFHGGKKESKHQSPDRENDHTRHARKYAGSKNESSRSGQGFVSEVKKKRRSYSDSDSSVSSRSPSRQKKAKNRKKRGSSSSSSASNDSSVDEKTSNKIHAKKKAGSDCSDAKDESKKRPRSDADKRQKRHKKVEKTRKRDDDRAAKRTRWSRSGSKDSAGPRRRRSRSRESRDSERRRRSRSREHRRRRSRSRESEHRRRRSRSVDSNHRRRRSRSHDSHRKQGRKRSGDSNDHKRRRRGRSSSS